MTQPLVSVIIPAYNSGKHIKECLNSVMNQTFQNWEAIVVLAPSTDNTFEILRGYFRETRIKIIREKCKSNCATARNIGFSKSTGDYIAFLDSDDWWEPMKLEVQVAYMEAHPELDWTMHRLIVRSGAKDEIWKVPDSPYLGEGILLFGGLWTILFKAGMLDDIKKNWGYLFNERMNHTDDADLVMRVWEYRYELIPSVLSGFRRNPDGLTSKANGFLESDLTTLGIALRNHRYSLLSFALFKNIVMTAINELTGIDWVKWKKEMFG